MFGQARLRCGEGRRSQRCTCNLVSTLLQPLGLSPQSGSSAELEQESLPKRNAVRARALAGGGVSKKSVRRACTSSQNGWAVTRPLPNARAARAGAEFKGSRPASSPRWGANRRWGRARPGIHCNVKLGCDQV